MQRGDQVEGELLTPVHFDLSCTPVNDPVFQDATTRVQLEFCLAIASLIETSRREDLNHHCASAYQGFIPYPLVWRTKSSNKVHEFQNAVLIRLFHLLMPYFFQGHIGCVLCTSVLFVLTHDFPKHL